MNARLIGNAATRRPRPGRDCARDLVRNRSPDDTLAIDEAPRPVPPDLQCAQGLCVPTVCREHHDARLRPLRAYRLGGLHPIHRGHREIHGGDIGQMLAKALDRLHTVARLSNDLHVLFAIDDGYDSHTQQRMVVDDQYCHTLRWLIRLGASS
jgi:hypothetical protein